MPFDAAGDHDMRFAATVDALRALTAIDVRRDLVDEEVRQQLLAVTEVVEAGIAAQRALAAEVERRGAQVADGAVSVPRWLEATCGIRTGDGRRLCREGRLLDELPEVACAAAELGVAKVSLLLGAATGRTAEAFRRDAATLVERLRGVHLGHVPALLRVWRRLADQDGADPAVDRRVRLVQAWDLWVLDGDLEAESGLLVKAALDHRARQLREDDAALPDEERRTWDQLRHDALVELVVKGGAVADGVRSPTPAVVVTVPLEDLERGTGVGTSVDRRTVLPIRAVERMACGGRWRRLVLGAPSVVLDLGRSTADVSPHQRLAGAVADGCCRFPGCARPADGCDQHHCDEWERDGGPTDQRNLVTLCRGHHVLVHRDGWQLRRRPDGTVTATRRRDGLVRVDPPMPQPRHLLTV